MPQPRRVRSEVGLEDQLAALAQRVRRLENLTKSKAGTWVIEERDGEVWAVNYVKGRTKKLT